MDRGLEEIDDLLSTKGRLSVFGPPQASSEGEAPKIGNHRPSSAAGRDGPYDGLSVTAGEVTTAAAGDGGWEQAKGDVGRSAPGSTQSPQHIRSARGTGANAACVLMSATAPTASAGALVASSFLDQGSTTRELGWSSSAAMINGDDRGVHSNQAPCGSEEVTPPPKGGVRSYMYEPGVHVHGGGNTDHLYSPPRRREKEVTPFIRAKGLTLTYAQAKLFGLAGSPHPAVGAMKSDLKTNVTWPGPGSQAQTTGGTRCTGLGESTRDSRQRQPQQNPRRTYSPSRMEQLSNPVPGRGRFGDSCIGGGKSADRQREGDGAQGRNGGGREAPFTWKRSRKAEAAMRYVVEFCTRETMVEQRLQPVMNALS